MSKFLLLVDDDLDEGFLFKEALAKINRDIRFHHVPDSQLIFQFLADRKNSKPDLIFLDINMPIITGWECLNLLKAHNDYNNIPVIMYSTSSNAADKLTSSKLGATNYFQKPQTLDGLVDLLTGIIEK